MHAILAMARSPLVLGIAWLAWGCSTILGEDPAGEAQTRSTHQAIEGADLETRPENSNKCSPDWYAHLAANPAAPTGEFTDANTGYASLAFFTPEKTRLVLKTRFPMVRFMSFSTSAIHVATLSDAGVQWGNAEVTGALFDYQIKMDPGSVNPYEVGASIHASPRDFTVDYLSANTIADSTLRSANVLRMGHGPVQLLELRYTSPDAEVHLTEADLPTLYAFNSETGEPARCPTFFVPPARPKTCVQKPPPSAGPIINFKLGSTNSAGYNMAIPAYVISEETRMDQGQVAVIRFKAPTFVNTFPGIGLMPAGKNVRYWSISAYDPSFGWATIGGVPDYVAKMNERREVTVVVGPAEIAAQARKWNHNFIEDRRETCANSIILNFRNILPSEEFWPDPSAYPAANMPSGRVCEAADYLAGRCAVP